MHNTYKGNDCIHLKCVGTVGLIDAVSSQGQMNSYVYAGNGNGIALQCRNHEVLYAEYFCKYMQRNLSEELQCNFAATSMLTEGEFQLRVTVAVVSRLIVDEDAKSSAASYSVELIR